MKTKKDKIETQVEFYFEQFETFTQITSSICRQLAFAEGALFWFIKVNFHHSMSLIIWSFVFLFLYFIFDAIQYLIGYRKYYVLAKRLKKDYESKKNYPIEHYELPEGFNESINTIFVVKLIPIAAASLLLIVQFILAFAC